VTQLAIPPLPEGEEAAIFCDNSSVEAAGYLKPSISKASAKHK
jgi:hypothetical protein